MDANDLHNLLIDLGISQIRQRGNNFQALCPFHDEKTPSWGISMSEPHLYGCFGCQAKGSVLSLLLRIGKWSYSRACKFLKIRETPDDRLSDLNAKKTKAIVGEVDRSCLYPYALERRARRYLYRRGISLRIALEARLCYIPDIDRIVFPWYKGKRLEAVTGRTLSTDPVEIDEIGKLIPLFGTTKAHSIYLPARRIIPQKPLILVEGEIDALKVLQAGYLNVAALGHGLLTKGQILAIRNSPAEEVICFLDNDDAGERIRESVVEKLTGIKLLSHARYPKRFRSKFKDPGEMDKYDIRHAVLNRVKVTDWIEI